MCIGQEQIVASLVCASAFVRTFDGVLFSTPQQQADSCFGSWVVEIGTRATMSDADGYLEGTPSQQLFLCARPRVYWIICEASFLWYRIM